MTTPSLPVSLASERLWIADPRAERGVLLLGALLPLALIVPYLVVGPAIIGPAFALHVVALSLPHHAFTLFKSAPRASRTRVALRDSAICLAIAVPVSVAAAFSAATLAGRVMVTAIGLLSVWHIYRQHLGLCRIYTSLQQRRSGDRTLAADLRALEPFLALGSFAMVAYLFSQPELRWDNGGGTVAEPVYAPLPAVTPWLVYGALAVLGLVLAARMIARSRAGRFVPWPQLLIAIVGVTVNNLPFLFVTTDATLLVVTIASSFHVVQYFVFVWSFETARAPSLDSGTLPWPQRQASRARRVPYFAAALGYSLALVLTVPLSATVLGAPEVGVFLITLSNVLHYLVDGLAWRRSHDPTVERAMLAWAAR